MKNCNCLFKKFSLYLNIHKEKIFNGQGNTLTSPGMTSRGGFRGGGGRTPPPPQGFDLLPTQRVPPLTLFQKSIFGRLTLKFF